VDKLLHEDLEVMARSGMNTTEAVRYCLNMLAHAYTAAWRQGTPEGEIPEGLAITKIG
jgi:hypothetical protein